ncbi:LytR/AlgR family response regulator transcription factor [Algibacter lectus]|uniref:LytR/AlgR family response regulator transcription factor n=1 Tax=Algibacter lectus TaxID=221126 RepID=UPI0024947B31|nr:LytTR family DNA-binding domain-containing protein [Algibacter lectus]
MIKAIIVDDESNAIEGLLWELSKFSYKVQVVTTFTDPELALEYLKEAQIDCVFLDIEMPIMDGFTFLEKVPNRSFSVVITTAYNEYALKALKKEAIDYLLKPIDSDDLKVAIHKIEKQVTELYSLESFEIMLLKFNNRQSRKKITISTDGKLVFLEPDDIFYVESDGNYCTIYCKNQKKLVVTKKLKSFCEILPDEQFFRIHNSYIVNLNKVKEFIKVDGYIVLENNAKIPVSRQRKTDLLRKL